LASFAGLGAVAEQAIVRTAYCCSVLAALHRIADLIPITEIPIVTDRIVGAWSHLSIASLQEIDGAVHTVIAVNRDSILADAGDRRVVPVAFA